MKCKTCQQELPALLPGDIVEDGYTGRIGIIPEPSVLATPTRYDLVPVILIHVGHSSDLANGALTYWRRQAIRKVHGFIRITERV